MAFFEEHTYKMIQNMDLGVSDADLDVIHDRAAQNGDPRWTMVKDHRPSLTGNDSTDYGPLAVVANLTDEEAADATLSHFFTDYTAMTPEQVISIVKPMMLRDENILTDVRRGAISYFYAKDQDSAGRAQALAAYGDALSMATAGSVEGCLEALLYMTAMGTIPAGDEAFTAQIVQDLQGYLLKFPR